MPADPEEVKCGKMRSTMKTNVLIDKPEIGQVHCHAALRSSISRSTT